jgi:hypothetical protein
MRINATGILPLEDLLIGGHGKFPLQTLTYFRPRRREGNIRHGISAMPARATAGNKFIQSGARTPATPGCGLAGPATLCYCPADMARWVWITTKI